MRINIKTLEIKIQNSITVNILNRYCLKLPEGHENKLKEGPII